MTQETNKLSGGHAQWTSDAGTRSRMHDAVGIALTIKRKCNMHSLSGVRLQ